jgi:hypothetical protein
MATASVTSITGTPRTFSKPDKAHEYAENEMAKRQYSTKWHVAGVLAKKKITRPVDRVLSDVRRTFGVAVYTVFGYTTHPTGYEADVDMQRRLRRAKSAVRQGLGVLHYCKRYSKNLKFGMTKEQWTQHRRLVLAFEDLEAQITKIFAKYKIS